MKVLWLSFGSYNDFSGLSKIINLQKLWVRQVRGFDNEIVGPVLQKCRSLWALKLDNLKHVINLGFIPGIPKLKYISFEGIKNLDTYAPIKDSKALEVIAGYKCRPADKSLNGLMNLKEIWLGDSYPKTEIDKLLSSKATTNIWIRGKNLKGTGNLKNPFDLNEN